MAVSQLPADGTTRTASSPYNLLLATFFAAILMSAALLFAVQPMFTKMVLPRLGGAAAVWSVAMVFFQATLLAGYAYAHLLTRFAPGRGSVLIHLAVLLIACLSLPLHLAGGWGQPPSRDEAFWLLLVFAPIGDLAGGGRCVSRRGSRASALARSLGVRRTSGGTLGPSARSHPPHLHRRGGCPVVLGPAARDLPIDIRDRFPIPA